jgi:Rod binding domain-containing protein
MDGINNGPPAVAAQAVGSASGPRAKDDPVAIQDAARQFEALLLAQLLRATREAGSEGWLGTGEDQTASSAMGLAEEQFAQALSAQGGLGLASLIVSGLARESGESGAPGVGDVQMGGLRRGLLEPKGVGGGRDGGERPRLDALPGLK